MISTFFCSKMFQKYLFPSERLLRMECKQNIIDMIQRNSHFFLTLTLINIVLGE